MNIIAVDDEKLALELTVKAIEETVGDCRLTGFTSPSKALEYAQNNKVDIAFLDIEMGGMNGLELAKNLKDIYGKTNIVFITGYSQYALESYLVEASEYLLKPVDKQGIIRAIEHLRYPIEHSAGKRMHIQAFGNFEVFLDGKPFHFSRSKSKEILAYLIYKNGASCTIRELAAALEDNSEKNMQTYISAMMKDLKEAGQSAMIIKSYNSIAVNPAEIDCDYYRFLKGDAKAVNAYMGEFMIQYSWAEFLTGYLDGRI